MCGGTVFAHSEETKITSNMKTKVSEQVTVCCDNLIERWESRKRAIEFYLNAMRCTEGCESERYMDIYLDLIDGKEVCTDSMSNYWRCIAEGRYAKFNNPNNTRDYNNKIYYPIH